MYFRVLACLLAIANGILPLIDAAVTFTQVPPPILYVPNGGTAKLIWNYHVDDRNSEFFTTSPEWYYSNGAAKIRIAAEVKTYVNGGWEWRWTILSSCPERLKHRVSKESVATLVISNSSTLDNGNYSCVVVLHSGQNPRSLSQLLVTVRPKFSINPPSSVVISETSNLAVPCAATGQPTPNITWLRIRDQTVMTQGVGSVTLSIRAIGRDQNGTYECQATNNPNESPIFARTNVIVEYAPTITTKPKDIAVTKGDPIVLTCSASGNPLPTISWSKENGSIRPGHATSGNILKFPYAVKTDAGKYICKATNVYEMVTRTRLASAYVSVKYQPIISSKSQDQIINETSPLHLTCIIDSYPAPNITWTKSPGPIRPSVTTGNKYRILSAKITDAGTYTCTASNGIGRKAVASIHVSVQYKAEIDASNSTNTLDSWKGKQIRMWCSFSGNPVPRITWYKPSGSKVTSPCQRTTSDGGTFLSELNITTTSPEDYGKYKCLAANDVGTDEHFIVVKQLFTPYQPEESHMVSDSKGTQVTIFWCVPGVKGGTPVIDYKVEINSNPPREMITKYTFAEIKDLKENTKYTVKVYARNKAGYGDPVERVIVTGNPENYSTFVVASLSTILAISLLTNALFVFIIIKVQRKEREGKHRFHKPTKNISYENKTDVEMEDIAHDERDHPTDTNRDGISNQIETSSGALEDNASHYQSLSSATRRPVEARPPQLYEPLITKADKPQQSEYASLQINSRSNPKAVEGKQSPESKDQ